MKISKIEKIIIAVIMTLLIVIVSCVTIAVKKVDEAGGVKAVIVEIGKEVKDISKQINEESDSENKEE